MGKSRNNKEQDIFKRGNNNSELSNLKGLISPYGDDDDEENINDYCDDFTMPPSCGCCGTEMRFSIARLKFMCPNCGHTLYLDEYALEGDDNADYDEYYEDPDDDIPECCIDCGGPYPSCRNSCKIFDD